MKYLVIDSGTTNSRVRLLDENRVIDFTVKPVGARNVSIGGDNRVLKIALKEGIEELLGKNNIYIGDIEAIIASGMISSNVGLADVPHIEAPAGAYDLSKNIKKIYFPDIIDKEIYFIPGIKTGFDAGKFLEDKDIMRGEETEIFGYLSERRELASQENLFFHYGSHHKCIKTKEGKIADCATAVTGELLMALYENTILKSSLLSLEEVKPISAWVKEGIRIAEYRGFGRALFSTRVLEVLEGRSKQECTSFYLGTLLSLDLELIDALIREDTRRIILYGKKLFPSIAKDVLTERYPHTDIIIVPEEQADLLSAKGAVWILGVA